MRIRRQLHSNHKDNRLPGFQEMVTKLFIKVFAIKMLVLDCVRLAAEEFNLLHFPKIINKVVSRSEIGEQRSVGRN